MEKAWNSFRSLYEDTGYFDTECFKCIKTDEDRIRSIAQMWIRCGFRPEVLSAEKDCQKSKEVREQGNAVYAATPFTKHTCLDAIKLYNKSIRFAPKGSNELAIAYANRSAVLYRMKKYAECCADIERAFIEGYPEVLKSKLHLRKVECLTAMRHPRACDAVEEARNWLVGMSINELNRKKFEDKLSDIQEKQFSYQKTKSSSMKIAVPRITNPNSEITCASDAIVLKYNKKFGRHVVAARDIEPGELLVVEKPYSVLLRKDNWATHCNYCLEVCWALIPCEKCLFAMYCTEDCRNAAWKESHDYECPMLYSLLLHDLSNLDLMSLRLTIGVMRREGGIENVKKLMAEVDSQEDERTKGFSNDGKYQSDTYRSVYSLITNSEKRSGIDLMRRAFFACVVVYHLSNCTEESMFSDTSVCSLYGTLLLRHQQMIACNGHSMSEESGLLSQERALAVMPFLSLINHACDNNIMRYSVSGYEFVRALFPIEKGQPLLDNYGPYYALLSKNERQKELADQYHFFCDCIPCREDWPLYDGIKSYKVLVRSAEKRNTIARALTKVPNYFRIAQEADPNVDLAPIIKDLTHMLSVLYYNAPLPCVNMNDVVETLKRCYALQCDRFELPEIEE